MTSPELRLSHSLRTILVSQGSLPSDRLVFLITPEHLWAKHALLIIFHDPGHERVCLLMSRLHHHGGLVHVKTRFVLFHRRFRVGCTQGRRVNL